MRRRLTIDSKQRSGSLRDPFLKTHFIKNTLDRFGGLVRGIRIAE